MKPFHDNCANKLRTLCLVKVQNGKVWGIYTDIPWTYNNEAYSLNYKSFIFKFNEDDSITKFKHCGEGDEVIHSSFEVFNMDEPVAILWGDK